MYKTSSNADNLYYWYALMKQLHLISRARKHTHDLHTHLQKLYNWYN